MSEHTLQDLKIKQALPLDIKVNMTKARIKAWVDHFGLDGVYVSFSGGKDSTVLLHIARQLYSDIKAVFVDTGLEFPEIREFVKGFDNVEWIRPKLTFKQVIEKYGYPFISKEVTECVQGARSYLTELDKQTDITNHAELVALLKKKMANREGGANERLLILLGELPPKTNKKNFIPDKSKYNQEKYKFLLDAPFEISNKCCNVMKKAPAHAYSKQTGRMPILATMAEESRLRTQKWLQYGCNGFNMKSPVSTPIAFWTEQDILQYIKENNIEICSVYGDIVPCYDREQFEGQMDIADFGLADDTRKLKTTKCDRTGCMFCMFGCVAEKESRLVRLKQTHPKQYEFIMKPKEKGGLGYKEVIDWINEHGGLNIKY